MPLLAISALMRLIASAIGTALLTRTIPSSLSARAAEATETTRSSISSDMPKLAKRWVKRRVMVRLLFLGACRLHGFGHRMTAGTGEMKCELALNSIAPGYRLRYAVGYRLRYAPAIAFDMP